MPADLRLLAWLRWRQYRDGAVYWLRVLGYQSGERSIMQQMYVVYLLGIGAIWAFAMWAWAYDITSNLAGLLDGETIASLINFLPLAVLVTQVYVISNGIRSTPLKLSFADMSYIAATPIDRSAPVVLGFLRQTFTRWLLFSIMWAPVAVLLAAAFDPDMRGIAPLRAVGGVLLIVLLTWATAWLLGIMRLVDRRVRGIPLLWAAPVLLLALLPIAPDMVLWPGRALLLIIYGQSPWWLLLFLVGLGGVLVALFLVMSRRIDMIQAVDESVLYARVQALGLLAWRQLDLQMRIRMRSAQAARKPWFRLPRTQGAWTIAARAGLSFIRHPFLLVLAFIWGALMALLGVLIIGNELPIQVWIGWLLIVGIAPPVGLHYVFRIDIEEKFLRQLIPFSGPQLLLADVALPFLFVTAGAYAVWFTQELDPQTMVMGATFIPILVIVMTLCGAVALTTTRVLQTRILTTAASFGVIVVAGVTLGAWAALVAAGLAILLMLGVVVDRA